MTVRVTRTFDALRVHFGDTLHLHLPVKDIAIESWRDYGLKKFVIEYTLHTGALVVTEYDNVTNWQTILNGLETTLAPREKAPQ